MLLLAGVALKRVSVGALGLVMIGGAMIALTSPAPAKLSRWHRAESSAPSGLASIRAGASRSIDEIFRADAPIAKALLVADQHEVPPEVRDRYARAGMVHMLSISGLHVAIIAGAVFLLLEAARLPRGVATMLGIGLIGCYVAVIGAPAPAVRSAIMLTVIAASRATQRPTSPWAALAVGAFVPLVVPRTALLLGYQLSVAGMAGIIASGSLSRRLIRPRLHGWREKVAADMLTSAVATLVTAPIIAWYFGRLSLVAPLANLLAGPVIAVLQPTLFLAMAFSPNMAMARFVADAAHPLVVLFDGIATNAAALPMASVAVTPSLITVVAGGGAVIFFLVACMDRYPARHLRHSALCVVIIAWGPAVTPRHHGDIELHFLDVGQGDAILLRTDRGRWVLFDAGRVWRTGDAGRATIIPYVMTRGGEVEAFVLSHAHADHAGGAASVMRALRPREFWDAGFALPSAVYSSTLKSAAEAGSRWHRVHPGDTMKVDGVTIRFLAPDSAWTSRLDDPNEASTVALVEFGTSRFLLTGDAERGEEKWLLDNEREYLHADVLKVAHHGSSTSSTDEFLAAVDPALAVISVGADNLYGHPSVDILAALSRVGAVTVRTDRSGTVIVRSNGRRITYEAAGETWDISRP